MSLDSSALAETLEQALEQRIEERSPGDIEFEEVFAQHYHEYVIAGEVPGAEPGQEDPSIIEDALLNSQQYARIGDASTTLDILSAGFANYYATAHLEHGDAQVQNVVVNVTNNAASQIDSFRNAILIAQSDAQFGDPPFVRLIEYIEQYALPNVIWTVTEMDGDGSTFTYPRNIS